MRFDLMARMRGVCRRPSSPMFRSGDIPVAFIILAIFLGELSRIAVLRQARITVADVFDLVSSWFWDSGGFVLVGFDNRVFTCVSLDLLRGLSMVIRRDRVTPDFSNLGSCIEVCNFLFDNSESVRRFREVGLAMVIVYRLRCR